jgi:hypothetical protein
MNNWKLKTEKFMNKLIGIASAIIGLCNAANTYAGCGVETVLGTSTNYCESNVVFVGVGANGSPGWSEGVVYVTLSDDGAWFWDNSTAKNMTLSAFLTAKTAGQKVQVRWVAGSQGLGSKKITSVLLIP